MPTDSFPAELSVTPIPAFNDNYIWCLHNEQYAVVVDPGDADPVLAFCKDNDLALAAILITHHHHVSRAYMMRSAGGRIGTVASVA